MALALLAAAVVGTLALAGGGGPSGGGAAPGEAAEKGDGSTRWTDEVEALLDERGVSYQRLDSRSDRDVQGWAASLLEERRAHGDCVLVRSGYLDLFGRAWGCVLQGSGWVEIALVTEDEGGAGCSAVVWRMDGADVAREAGPSPGDPASQQ